MTTDPFNLCLCCSVGLRWSGCSPCSAWSAAWVWSRCLLCPHPVLGQISALLLVLTVKNWQNIPEEPLICSQVLPWVSPCAPSAPASRGAGRAALCWEVLPLSMFPVILGSACWCVQRGDCPRSIIRNTLEWDIRDEELILKVLPLCPAAQWNLEGLQGSTCWTTYLP